MSVTQHRPSQHESSYDTHRLLIDQIIAGTARHHRLTSDDASEFRSYSWERMLSADPLKQFQQRCSLRTFLTVVVRNYYRDFQNHRWGKWRPSMEARRLGPVALRLELLVARDGFSFDEAVEIIRTNDALAVSRSELEALQLRLPARTRIHQLPEEALEAVASPPAGIEQGIERERRHAVARLLRQALANALLELEPQDRVILRLLFENGFSVAQVAAAMHLPQKPLYRRRDQLLSLLRSRLEASGVSPFDVEEFIGTSDDEPERYRRPSASGQPAAFEEASRDD